MGKITGFLEFERSDRDYEPVEERIRHWREFVLPLPDEENTKQAARCMDCGIPYCHTGCPVNNQIPDWNDLVYRGNWQEAARNLHTTNNFPEVTGRVCPAPCEASCTLNIDDNPVAIKTIECAIADRAFEQGWIKPEPPSVKTGRKVAIVGSGPAGMACAQQLAPRRPRRARVREIRQSRRPASLRHSRLQDGEVSRRSPRRADGYGRRDVPLRHPCRRQPAGRGSAQGLRCARARGRRGEGARSADPGARARRHPFRHGIPAAAEPPRQRRAAGRERADPRRRQARRRHRRRRHRLRLHRHLDPPGRALGARISRSCRSRRCSRTRC